MAICLTDFPEDILQEVLCKMINGKKFVMLCLVSKKMNQMFTKIWYFNRVNYSSIKKIRDKSRFKNLILDEASGISFLEEINPKYLFLRLSKPNRRSKNFNTELLEVKSIPQSVTCLGAKLCDLTLDPELNKNLNTICLIDTTLKGKIPKYVHRLTHDCKQVYKFDNPDFLKTLVVFDCFKNLELFGICLSVTKKNK